jgi:hypothetical protein
VSQDARIGKLILVPALITLAVTLLRLVGELQGWSPVLFNRGTQTWSPSLVGIVWLVPVFGAWFGWKLTRAGSGPRSLGRAVGLELAALAVLPLAAFLAPKAGIVPERMWRPNVPLTESLTILSVFVAVFIVGIAIGIRAWPALGRTLLAYGLAARVPVALLMLVAMLGNWGTHYDARPGAAAFVLDLVHDRVRCAVRNRRSCDRAAAGNGSRLDNRTRRARGDGGSGRAQGCTPSALTRILVTAWSRNTSTYGALPCCAKPAIRQDSARYVLVRAAARHRRLFVISRSSVQSRPPAPTSQALSGSASYDLPDSSRLLKNAAEAAFSGP